MKFLPVLLLVGCAESPIFHGQPPAIVIEPQPRGVAVIVNNPNCVRECESISDVADIEGNEGNSLSNASMLSGNLTDSKTASPNISMPGGTP